MDNGSNSAAFWRKLNTPSQDEAEAVNQPLPKTSTSSAEDVAFQENDKVSIEMAVQSQVNDVEVDMNSVNASRENHADWHNGETDVDNQTSFSIGSKIPKNYENTGIDTTFENLECVSDTSTYEQASANIVNGVQENESNLVVSAEATVDSQPFGGISDVSFNETNPDFNGIKESARPSIEEEQLPSSTAKTGRAYEGFFLFCTRPQFCILAILACQITSLEK